jgi:acyl-coenzyme A thioesterase PaaI-like protein
MSSGTAAVQARTKAIQPKAKHCYVCGPENPQGMRVQFVPDGPHGSRTLYTARAEHNGWPGILHGGVTFSLMDDALGWALHFQGWSGVTARAETRFRQPVPIGTKLIIRGWTLGQRRRVIMARAEIRVDDEQQTLLAETDATMYLMDTAATE